MLKFTILFCLILAPAWSMEYGWENDTSTQEPYTRSSFITTDEAHLKLTYFYKSNSNRNVRKRGDRTIDMIIPLQEISNEIPFHFENMSLIEELQISIANPLAKEGIAEEDLYISVIWPKKDQINLTWEWRHSYGVHDIVGIFPGNRKTIDLYHLLAQELFDNAQLECPNSFATVCERLILTFDQPTPIMSNISTAPSH